MHRRRIPATGNRAALLGRGARLIVALAFVGTLSACGYNDIQVKDEAVKSAWSQVLNQYQRRADLIPNLVNTVKGYADHEQQVLTAVTEARSRVGQVKVDPTDPASLKQFDEAQRDMSSALSRLLVVTENYPQLKADANFRELQAQLEGTENRISVERKRYIDSVQDYNVYVRQFPVNLTAMAFGYKEKPQFSVENEREISRPPSVSFDKPAAAPAAKP
ncbi:MAG: LemA family protein [Burkholderiaceae bacterium]